MLLQLSLLPLVLGRAALPHSRSMVYVPPIWATLDCSACSPGYSGVVTFFHTLLAVWGPVPPCCKSPYDSPESKGEVLSSAPNCGKKGLAVHGPPLLARGGDRAKQEAQDDEDPLRLVGAKLAFQNEIPWQVSLLHSDGTWAGCGAALLSCSPLIVVTAAHCIKNINEDEDVGLYLGFGSHVLEDPAGPGSEEVRLPVSEIVAHPGYKQINLPIKKKRSQNRSFLTGAENDIAILKVNATGEQVCKERVIWPACLPDTSDYSLSSPALTSGWGTVQTFGDWSRQLRKVRIPIVSDEECARNVFHYSFPSLLNLYRLADGQICAGDIEEVKGVCRGDSGGPLVARPYSGEGEERKPWHLVGLSSWVVSPDEPGGGCGENTYTVFTEVSKYLSWIAEQFDMVFP